MVKNDPSSVPERYIRNPEDVPKCINTIPSSDIPQIDFSLLLERHDKELKKLDKACEEWGFFQVVNHGIEKELLQMIKDATKSFLDLPLEEKNKYAKSPNDIQGYGHSFVVSEEQKLDWQDDFGLIVFPQKFRRYEYWPTTPEVFKDIVEKYSSEIRRIGKELIDSISINMGLDKGAFLDLHGDLNQTMKVNYYPPCAKPDQVIGFSPHSDITTITVLFQEEDVSGLQLRHNNQWVPVEPIPGALVVNVGDILEIWSNGKYKSIEHRAVTNKNKERTSFASFFYPPDNLGIEPLDNMIDYQGGLRMYRKVTYGEYLREFITGKLQGKAHTEKAKLQPEEYR